MTRTIIALFGLAFGGSLALAVFAAARDSWAMALSHLALAAVIGITVYFVHFADGLLAEARAMFMRANVDRAATEAARERVIMPTLDITGRGPIVVLDGIRIEPGEAVSLMIPRIIGLGEAEVVLESASGVARHIVLDFEHGRITERLP